jgi:hypothetical protein
MCDDLIAAHQKEGLMGDYQPVLRNTGRGFAGMGERLIARIERTDGKGTVPVASK